MEMTTRHAEPSSNHKETSMQILFDARDPESARLKELAERRLRFSVRRLSWFVGVATVRLVDRHGGKGRPDKCCEIEIETVDSGRVAVTSHATDWWSALEAAFARVARALQRAWRRGRQGPRRLPDIESH
jgi:hypothetical protein